MKFLGFKEIALKSIIVDAVDIRRRQTAPHVLELGKSIQRWGGQPLHAPVVWSDANQLLCGRDRFAAILNMKAKKVWVHIAECTAEEARELEEVENIYRRHSDGERSAALARLVAIREVQIRAEETKAIGDTVPDPGGASREPKSDRAVKVQARKDVARAAGITPASVKKAEQRAKAEPATVSTVQSDAAALPEGFNAFGMEVDPATRAAIACAVDMLVPMDFRLREMARALTTAEKTQGYAISPVLFQKAHEAIKNAGHFVRVAVPASLCFYCKAQPSLVVNCHACGGAGVVGCNGVENVPKELQAGGADARVAVDGKYVPIGGAANAAEAAKPERAKKSIKVKDATGESVDLDKVASEDGDEELAF